MHRKKKILTIDPSMETKFLSERCRRNTYIDGTIYYLSSFLVLFDLIILTFVEDCPQSLRRFFFKFKCMKLRIT